VSKPVGKKTQYRNYEYPPKPSINTTLSSYCYYYLTV